ncbi:hypothetical protein HNQ94_002611 [Salirhabdus euzebyi]|uniref:Glyoxalase-like domain-containing protein n=1 Tax=Salirhabdus euzebyi TaxID=394506 RepID=A0A841Q6X0_9BACI|nr:VOC family protein [Salirhabdus euzebyi]MBB6454160.1 hypothetical protein [Salirhabdus euzebyi]
MIAFDHLVIFSHSIEEAQSKFADNHTINIVKGGHHELWGTYNYLAYMRNNSYIEWLGIENEEIAVQSDNPLIKHTAFAHSKNMGGPIQFALRTSEMDTIIQGLDERNIPYTGPFPGSRRRPDGSVLKWRMLFPAYKIETELLPFLIEWEGEGNIPSQNFLNDIPFTSISLGVTQLEKEVKRMQEIYQLEAPTVFKENNYHIAEWELENGKMKVVQGLNKKIEATFDQLHF